jgi:hypothetical protein
MWYMTWKRINAANSVGVGKPQGRSSLRRTRRRWKDSIKTDFKGIVWEMDWIGMAPSRGKCDFM